MTGIGSSVVRIFLIAVGLGASVYGGDTIQVLYDEPTLDRWNYPFNATPGERGSASVFAAFFEDFDDRDAQFLVGFETSSDVPPGLPVCAYEIVSATLVVENLNGGIFAYDPTYDPYPTYLPDGDPDAQSDSDAGRPLEVYGTAYRNGFTAETYVEDSPFGSSESTFKGTRNAFATDNFGGLLEDVSNNVDGRFDPVPFAIGQNDSLSPGQIVPSDVKFTFDLDVSNPDVQSYLAGELQRGEIRLTVSSLQPAEFDGEGGGGGAFASFYTRENLIHELFGDRAATLDIEVNIRLLGDANGDGQVNFSDLTVILFSFGPADGSPADVDCSGEINFSDLTATLFRFTG